MEKKKTPGVLLSGEKKKKGGREGPLRSEDPGRARKPGKRELGKAVI